MAHVQRRCSRRACRRVVPQGARRCPACGSGRSVWVGRVRGPDGTERSRVFRTRIDAERFTAGSEVSKARGEWVDPALGRIPLSEWASTWLKAVRPALKPKTVRSYDSLINSRLAPTLGDYPIAALAPMDVQEWVNAMRSDGLSASRIRQGHVVLSQILTAAVREGRIGRNVALGIKLPPIPRMEAEYFEPDVVERIASSVREPYDLFVRLLGKLGPRYGEAAALRRRCVNLLARRLAIEESMAEVSGHVVFGPTKTHAMRKLPLPPTLAAAFGRQLEEHVGPEPEALLFTSPAGAPLRYRNFMSRVWKPTLLGLGLPDVGVHVLRHSAAAALIQSGASATAVQKILGHRSAAFTLTVYGHIFDADLDLVAENLDQAWAGREAAPEPGRGSNRLSGGLFAPGS
jgi:integrase